MRNNKTAKIFMEGVMFKRSGFAVCALAVVVAVSAAPAAQTPAPAQTPAAVPTMPIDEIVAKHLATKGGADKWKTIQTQKMTGVAISQGFQLALTVFAKRPNKARQELTVEVPGRPVMTIVNLYDGTKAWTINPMSGDPAPQSMPDSETAIAKAQSDFDGVLVDYKAKGYTVVEVDQARVAGRPTHHLKVTRNDVPAQHIYLDPETFVEMRVTTEGPTASETDLSDYKEVAGVMVPHTIKISQNGVLQAELRISKVEFNLPLDDALFRIK
jgi:outer membrane lipoprotein-sorting protein